MKRYVQYGCGFYTADEWINYDASPTLRFERLPLLGGVFTRNAKRFPKNVIYGDIVRGLPEKADSCDGLFCSHILEHLTLDDFRLALRNSLHILKPGGLFRGVVPDLRVSALQYLENFDSQESPASGFMRDTKLGVERSRSLSRRLTELFGNSKHLWMWDFKSLKYELETAGFVDVRSTIYGDSADASFLLVEREHRYFGAASFECSK